MNLITIKQKLKVLLKDNTFSRNIIGTRGLFNNNSLYKYKTSKRMFKHKLENSGKKYNLEILFDNSGSMAWHNGEDTKSDFYKGILVLKEVVKLFKGILNINIVFYNLIEKQYSINNILNLKLDLINTTDKQFDFMGENNLDLYDNKYIKGNDISSLSGNRDIINIQNAANRLYKNDGEKIIIIIGDGKMNIDSYYEEDLIQDDMHISGLSVRRYNNDTKKDIINNITSKGIKILGLELGKADFSYLPNYIKVNKNNIEEELFTDILSFIKKSFK